NHHLRPRRLVDAGRGLDLARGWPCSGRHFLRRRRPAPARADRSLRCAASAAAVHAGAAVVRGSLRRALLVDHGDLARNQRPAGRVPPQDAHSAVRHADGVAGHLPGDPCCARADGSMMYPELLAILMVVAVCGFLFFGYPVALTLGGVSLAFAALGHLTGAMGFSFVGALPQRVYGVMTNEVLLAIPLFIFMGVMLERSRIAEELLETMGRLFGTLRGGLGISVAIVGTLLAAAKGVVGATTVTMGLIVLPTMLRYGYDKRLAAGTVAATATLAQIFPPATVLVLLGDQLPTAYQAAQLQQGNFAPSSVTVSDLFAGAIVPAFALVALYILYLIGMAIVFPETSPAIPAA